jgi:predicted  nucleic acid-binding Zn-ribbon protein
MEDQAKRMSDQAPSSPLVPVSWGELFDKISILEIKTERIAAPAALASVRVELAKLSQVAADVRGPGDDHLTGLRTALRQINEQLWDVEDHIREKESAATFDDAFIELARSVYKLNDQRASLKRQINVLLKSEIVEEKSYAQY